MTSKLVLLSTFAAALATASPITITFTGIGSGSLGAQSFTSKQFSFTIMTDTTSFNKPPCCDTRDSPSGTPTTFFIVGVGSGTLTDDQVFFTAPSEAFAGIGHFNADTPDMIEFGSPMLTGYTFATSLGPITAKPDFVGACPGPDCSTFATTAGILQFSSVTTITFTATVNPFRTISHIADGAGFRTTFILMNTGATTAEFTLAFWKDTGEALQLDLGADGVTAALTGTIPAHGARFIRTAGSSPDLNPGWAQLNAPTAVDGNSIFGLQNPGHGDSEAAVALSPGGGADLFLPFDNTTGFVTGVAFANSDIHGTAATISGSFVDDTGSPISDTGTVPVPQHGHDANVLDALFPATAGKRGAAHFTAAENLFALGIRGNGKAFTSIEALSYVTKATKTIAHIASGGGWKTTFLLVNTGTETAQFTLDFFDDNGNALPLPLDSGSTTAILTATIPAGGLKVVKALNSGDLKQGWAKLVVTGPISGTAIFGLETAGQSDSEAATPFFLQGSTKLFMPFDYSTGYSTAIAFANPNPTPVNITLTLVDENGGSVSVNQVVNVPASGHKAIVLVNLFPDIAGERGTVVITSDLPVFGLGIRADGFAFTSLKVVTN
jgi:hypothetical protein